MTTSINDAYWNCLVSDSAYAITDSNAELLANLKTQSIVDQFTGNYSIEDITDATSSGFSAMVVQDKATGEFTIAFRGTEKSKPDWVSDAVGVTTGVAGDQIVDMYNYLARIFALPSSVVPQYSYNSLTGAVSQSGYADGLGLIPSTARVDFTGHSLGGELAMSASRLFSGHTKLKNGAYATAEYAQGRAA